MRRRTVQCEDLNHQISDRPEALPKRALIRHTFPYRSRQKRCGGLHRVALCRVECSLPRSPEVVEGKRAEDGSEVPARPNAL